MPNGVYWHLQLVDVFPWCPIIRRGAQRSAGYRLEKQFGKDSALIE
jgi:hypothetical protein